MNFTMRARRPGRAVGGLVAAIAAAVVLVVVWQSQANGPKSASDGPPDARSVATLKLPRDTNDAWTRFSKLPLWEDGLSEMCYYNAACTIYGRTRRFTRVHMFNRQFMDRTTHIKASGDSTDVVPAFKFVIAEQIPTENYNYRFLTTGFLERPSLGPIKLSASSQEWCGHTFKELLWSRDPHVAPKAWSMELQSFSYMPGEGDHHWTLSADVDAYESLFVLSRALVASGADSRRVRLLKSLRVNHGADPDPIIGVLQKDGAVRSLGVPFGEFDAQRVVLDWQGPATWFDIETTAPFRVVAFQTGNVQATLRFVERRAYWDRSWKSGFYKQNEAP